MAVPALPIEDYFTDEDYLPPRSPGLQPVKVNISNIAGINGKRGQSYELNADGDELDLDSPWTSGGPVSLGIPAPKKRRGPVSTPNRYDAVTRALLNLMSDGTGLSLGDSELENDFDDTSSESSIDFDHTIAPVGLLKPPARIIDTPNSTLKPPGDAFQRVARDNDIRSPSTPPLLPGQPFFSQQPTPVSVSANTKRKVRKRFGLPLIIDGRNESVTVMACPDTGSHESILPLELARRLGLQIDCDSIDDRDRAFSLANGKIVKSLGVASLRCSFGAPGVVTSGSTESLELMVHIFESLAVPAIIGAAFLEKTETFTKHRDRLVEELMPAMQSLRVCAVGKPNKGLVCRLDTFVGCANADTGSDLDLVGPKFVHQRGLRVKEGVEILQFADGSTGLTSGSIHVNFAIGNLHSERGFVTRGRELNLEFFILESLTSDILVGQDTLEELNVISQHGDLFIDSLPQPGLSDCNIIRHIGTVERTAKSALNAIKEIFTTFTGRDGQDSPLSPSSSHNPEDQHTAVQRENARLEAEAYGNRYQCQFAGCSAPPFPTQYLLNAHSDVHSSARPHYCPVRGCPRSEGGRGFKRKNEMIRHGIVHDSPGYVCPFCPDRDHRYPRPDNLQRHVRVHHVDKDKDDPLLRDVLAQRPDGPSRGRRRRE